MRIVDFEFLKSVEKNAISSLNKARKQAELLAVDRLAPSKTTAFELECLCKDKGISLRTFLKYCDYTIEYIMLEGVFYDWNEIDLELYSTPFEDYHLSECQSYETPEGIYIGKIVKLIALQEYTKLTQYVKFIYDPDEFDLDERYTYIFKGILNDLELEYMKNNLCEQLESCYGRYYCPYFYEKYGEDFDPIEETYNSSSYKREFTFLLTEEERTLINDLPKTLKEYEDYYPEWL